MSFGHFATAPTATMAIWRYIVTLASTGFILSSDAATTPYCKPTPGSSNWPSDADWQALNQSVSGRLLVPTPPGGVCHPDRSEFSNSSCTAFLTSSWTNSTWQSLNPWTSDYNDDTCYPDPSLPCSAAGYPAYVINATNAADVQAGVRFAKKTGVRLIVKGTGHDYPGRYAKP